MYKVILRGHPKGLVFGEIPCKDFQEAAAEANDARRLGGLHAEIYTEGAEVPPGRELRWYEKFFGL